MMLLFLSVGVSHWEDLFMLGVELALSSTRGAGIPPSLRCEVLHTQIFLVTGDLLFKCLSSVSNLINGDIYLSHSSGKQT